jgi:hypothetical protein
MFDGQCPAAREMDVEGLEGASLVQLLQVLHGHGRILPVF